MQSAWRLLTLGEKRVILLASVLALTEISMERLVDEVTVATSRFELNRRSPRHPPCQLATLSIALYRLVGHGGHQWDLTVGSHPPQKRGSDW